MKNERKKKKKSTQKLSDTTQAKTKQSFTQRKKKFRFVQSN